MRRGKLTQPPAPGMSPTPSSTVTPSWTASPTATITPTYTDSPTVTVTLTPAPKDGPLGIRRVVGVPNPNARSLVVELSGPADRVEAAVYSAAYARVLEMDSLRTA